VESGKAWGCSEITIRFSDGSDWLLVYQYYECFFTDYIARLAQSDRASDSYESI
jgi:hypothetical protein